MNTERIQIRIVMVALTLALSAILPACAPWSTYPPVETKMAQKVTKPTFEPVPTVMAVAVNYAKDRYLNGQDVAINLPEGAAADAYEKLFRKLGYGRPMTMPGEPNITIQEVRTRGLNAQTDVVYQRADGLYQLVTLTMSRGALDKYKVTETRVWQLRNVPAPTPHYVPPPVEEPKKSS
jgi:hypothetical protein